MKLAVIGSYNISRLVSKEDSFPGVLIHCLSIQDNVDYCEPSTSSAAATPQPSASEPAPTGSKDEQENLPSNPSEDKMEGGKEQVTEEVQKKSGGMRFRKKPKQLKQQKSKGLWFYVCMCGL